MRASRAVRTAAGAVLTIAVLVSAGCGRPAPAQVTSPWPAAESERVVPKPPEPPRWPLTGLSAPSHEATGKRVVSVKIENSPASRPQTALQRADVVYESLTEGGITRFNAIFHSQDPQTIGPVRSARLSDTYIVPQYDALFAFSGASGFVNGRVNRAGIANLSQDAGIAYPYFRSSKRRSPHNLYLDLAKLRTQAQRMGLAKTQQVRSFAYDRRSFDATPAVTKVTVPFSPAQKASWVYDGGSKTYLRSNNGKAHTEAETGKQIRARNVVVMWAKMKDSGHRDVTGSETYEIVLTGSGRVSVFHDGQRYDGVWQAKADSPPQFRDDEGKLIKLAPGNTWFQVVPTNVNIAMQ